MAFIIMQILTDGLDVGGPGAVVVAPSVEQPIDLNDANESVVPIYEDMDRPVVPTPPPSYEELVHLTMTMPPEYEEVEHLAQAVPQLYEEVEYLDGSSAALYVELSHYDPLLSAGHVEQPNYEAVLLPAYDEELDSDDDNISIEIDAGVDAVANISDFDDADDDDSLYVEESVYEGDDEYNDGDDDVELLIAALHRGNEPTIPLVLSAIQVIVDNITQGDEQERPPTPDVAYDIETDPEDQPPAVCITCCTRAPRVAFSSCICLMYCITCAKRAERVIKQKNPNDKLSCPTCKRTGMRINMILPC